MTFFGIPACAGIPTAGKQLSSDIELLIQPPFIENRIYGLASRATTN